MRAEGNWFIIFVISVSAWVVCIKLLQGAVTRFRVVPIWRLTARTGVQAFREPQCAFHASASEQQGTLLRLPSPIPDATVFTDGLPSISSDVETAEESGKKSGETEKMGFLGISVASGAEKVAEGLPRLAEAQELSICTAQEVLLVEDPKLEVVVQNGEGAADNPGEHANFVEINQGTDNVFESGEASQAELLHEPSLSICAVGIEGSAEFPALVATEKLSTDVEEHVSIENKSGHQDLLTTSEEFDGSMDVDDFNVLSLAASGVYNSWDEGYPILKLGTGRTQQSNRGRHAQRGDRDETRSSSSKWSSRTAIVGPFSRLGAQPSWKRMFSKKSLIKDEGTLPEPMRFKLTHSCKLVLQRGDITTWHVDGQTDAIVNAANQMMLGGGGVDGAIHRAAGPELLEACRELPEISDSVRCPVGEAVVTPGFKLRVSQIIHTVGPMYSRSEAAALLENAYKNSLSLARRQGVKYIAFPAISCGIYGYPADEAAKIALKTVKDYADGFVEIHFVLFEAPVCKAWLEEAEERLEKSDK